MMACFNIIKQNLHKYFDKFDTLHLHEMPLFNKYKSLKIGIIFCIENNE